MAAQIITTEDLMDFKLELLDEIQKLLEQKGSPITKKWLKSAEVGYFGVTMPVISE